MIFSIKVITILLVPVFTSFALDIKRLFENSENIFHSLTSYEPNNETKCIQEFKKLIDQVKSENSGKVLDSWSKEPVGLYSNVTTSFGQFDQCIAVTEPFGHQYCNVYVENISNLNYSMGICVPKSCDKFTAKRLLTPFFADGQLSVHSVHDCENGDNPPFGFLQWFTVALCSVLMGLAIAGTVNDTVLGKKGFLNVFSMSTNANKLFRLQSTQYGSMNCLNGIKVWAMFSIVLGHCYFSYLDRFSLSNPNGYDKFQSTFTRTLILQGGESSVDIFFMIAGLLMAYNFMKSREKRRPEEPFNVFKYYLHRYLRLIPAYAFVVMIMVSFESYLSSGPKKFEWTQNHAVNDCKKWWWLGLLLVQNYVNPVEECIAVSWYIAVDMQLFILSPLILFPLIKYGKKFVPVMIILSLASMGFIFVYSFMNKIHFNITYISVEYLTYIYYPTHAKISQWLVGIGLGYILYKTKNSQFKIQKGFNFFLWTASLTTLALIIYIPYLSYRDKTEDVLIFSLFASLHRPVCVLAVSWITFACIKGYGGIVNWFLSLPFFQPLAKLSYAVYIIHYPLIIQVASLQRNLVWFNEYMMFQFFFSILFFSFLLAIPVALIVEMPIANAEIQIYKIIESHKLKDKASSSIQM